MSYHHAQHADVMAEATISDDERYRYSLGRFWNPAGSQTDIWVMLNPSTADALKDDPTIKRCMAFSRSWGAGGIVVVNLYGWRATSPEAMWRHQAEGADIIGPETDSWIRAHITARKFTPARIVCAWGNHGEPERIAQVMLLLGTTELPVVCLGKTKLGQPRHPLYVKGTTAPEQFHWDGLSQGLR